MQLYDLWSDIRCNSNLERIDPKASAIRNSSGSNVSSIEENNSW
ncbi:hypothetical protein D1AOALGA4SA_5501 [Olavius algarvensis Delta 1 endosymbiont]|nr:hypothetical protein D1AOALGA4SA_5501 [Olavius algarvensis Delta 1 endosymbiont]